MICGIEVRKCSFGGVRCVCLKDLRSEIRDIAHEPGTFYIYLACSPRSCRDGEFYLLCLRSLFILPSAHFPSSPSYLYINFSRFATPACRCCCHLHDPLFVSSHKLRLVTYLLPLAYTQHLASLELLHPHPRFANRLLLLLPQTGPI